LIAGTGELPDCTEPAAANLSGRWFHNGQLEVLSEGCADAPVGTQLPLCSLDWIIDQKGSELDIVVDEEYRILGRLCGPTLHLKGGWWLPVEDPPFGCTYEDDSAAEVVIEAEGNTLEVQSTGELRGALVVRSQCTGRVDLELVPSRF